MAFGERPAGFGFAEGTWRRHLLQHGMVLLAALRRAHSAGPFLDLANRLRTQAIAAARLAVSCDTAGKSRARRWCWRSVGVGRAGGRPDRQHLWQVWKGGCDGYLFDHRVHLLLHMVDVAFNDDVRLVELVDLRTANQRALQTPTLRSPDPFLPRFDLCPDTLATEPCRAAPLLPSASPKSPSRRSGTCRSSARSDVSLAGSPRSHAIWLAAASRSQKNNCQAATLCVVRRPLRVACSTPSRAAAKRHHRVMLFGCLCWRLMLRVRS